MFTDLIRELTKIVSTDRSWIGSAQAQTQFFNQLHRRT